MYCIFDVQNLVLCLNRELIKIIDYKFMLKLQCKTTFNSVFVGKKNHQNRTRVDFGIMFLKNVVLHEIYSKKSQWPNTFGTSLYLIALVTDITTFLYMYKDKVCMIINFCCKLVSNLSVNLYCVILFYFNVWKSLKSR